ncbi:LOW QUALITY PROTEIN: hypothetical protein BRADI_2g01726v3 [Brachypodium distachyon]|uniref:F-box domain-containing protein n=1 Tax=Brachypodium distachyon TaxID=15368 RepID=A0A0Q3FSU4_BRADI|nr:LOW QUALITY PROTEIN: hypothetical protein BRADI_2g01726v3 [Brachypodium distachyon]
MAAALHGELLLDIFSRLPDPIDLLRCAATCGPWFRVILAAIAAGHLNLPQLHRSSFVLGAFYQIAAVVSAANAPGNKPPCPPRFDPASACGSFSSFLPNSDGFFSPAMPLASRRGLILSRVVMPTPLDRRKLHLAVSHPLLAGRTRLLPLPPLDLDLTGYALLPDVDDPGAFRVLITAIVVSDSGDHNLMHAAYCYYSGTGLWSAPTECPSVEHLAMSGPRAGTVDAHGTAHWLYRDSNSSLYTLAVAGDATQAALTKLPIILHAVQRNRLIQLHLQPLFPCLTGAGELALVHNRRPDAADGKLDLWINKGAGDHGGSTWVRRPEELAKYKAAPLELLKVVGFAESAGKLLVCSVGMLSWLDVESGKTEMASSRHYPRDVCRSGSCQGYDSCSECTYNCRVIYKVHWPSFLSQISAWS